MNISKHAIERYVERTMNKSGNDIKLYIAQNEEVVIERVHKLFNSSSLLYEGKLRDYSHSKIFVNKHGWVLIVDDKQDNLITVYKVDIGLDDEFNQMYIDKYKDR